jgi:hypothetical protein
MNNKVKAYLIPGVFLTYFGLKDDFLIWYNGIALILGLTSFVFAYLEYRKAKKEE